MILMISILSCVFVFLVINIIGAVYVGDSSNYNENKNIISIMEVGSVQNKKTKRKNKIVLSRTFSVKIFRVREEQRNKKLITKHFKEALKMINNSLKAGQSIDNAIIKCGDDMAVLYGEKGNQMFIESLQKIKFDLEIGVSLEDALYEFENKWNNEDISNFCDAIIAVRSKGGNMAEIMDNVIKIITDKMEINMEIDRHVYGKKFESKILSILPIAMFVILSMISRDYMSPLYDTVLGRVLIGISFILIYLNFRVSRRITNIEV